MSTTGGGSASVPETEALLQRVASMIAGARALPLSSSVKLDNKDEILELLREAIERLPEEVRQARWMIKEREEYLASTHRQSEELVEAARSEAQRLVQRTEIAKEAQAQARRTVEAAREEARRLRLEAEDYADQKLAQFEIVLERTLKTVASGRQKLAGAPLKDSELAAALSDSAPGGVPVVGPGGPPTSPGAMPLRPGGPDDWPARHVRSGAAGAEQPAGPDAGRADDAIFDQDLLS